MESKPTPENDYNRQINGVGLVLVGLVWLLGRMQILVLPDWVISLPSLIIFIGLLLAVKSKFQKIWPILITLFGVVYLLQKNGFIPNEYRFYFWPLVLIVFGLILILKPRRKHTYYEGDSWKTGKDDGCGSRSWKNMQPENYNADKLAIDAVFCGCKKQIISKDFKGGEINLVFGGAELNLSQADFPNEVTIDVSVVFGGLKIILPNNWELKTQLTTIAAGVEDNRHQDGLQIVPNKTLILQGTVVFGGIEIHNH